MTPVRLMRLVTGLLAVGALALLLSQAARLPGPAGDAIRENAAADRDATALFYTEVDGWPGLPLTPIPPAWRTGSASAGDSRRRSPPARSWWPAGGTST